MQRGQAQAADRTAKQRAESAGKAALLLTRRSHRSNRPARHIEEVNVDQVAQETRIWQLEGWHVCRLWRAGLTWARSSAAELRNLASETEESDCCSEAFPPSENLRSPQ